MVNRAMRWGVLLALLWIIFVGVSAAAAEAKGRGMAEGLLLGLFLGPIGMAIEALLPGNLDEQGHVHACPFCAARVRAGAETCRRCGREQPSVPVVSPAPGQAADQTISPWILGLLLVGMALLLVAGLGLLWLH